MKLAIVGSVNIDERQARDIIYSRIRELEPECIVSGGADGVDTLAEDAARDLDLPCIVCKPSRPSWPCFRERNLLIAEICDRLIRVYNPESKTYGSGWTLDQAERLGKPVESYAIHE